MATSSMPLQAAFFVLGIVFWAGCGHKPSQVQVPTAPPIQAPDSAPPVEARNPVEMPTAKIEVPADGKVIFEQTGMASWYGAPYHNRRGSNGEVYDMNAMTAAHLTLPLGSIVRVTNVKTGHSALLRITDRGPFVEGRILDLSFAAAKALDVYLPGVAQVHLEVLEAPAPIDAGGKWAVQIGPFHGEEDAAQLTNHLQRRYQTAKVLKFPSPIGDWWVRVRVAGDEQQRAKDVIRENQPVDAPTFLVRLD